jgi:hypothetical protein
MSCQRLFTRRNSATNNRCKSLILEIYASANS